MLRCCECNKELNNEDITYCEKCEEYYCMECSYKHVNHGIVFFRYENEKLKRILVGVSGAGGGDIHYKFYEKNNWISTRKTCEHAENMLKNNKPLFFCEDGKIRCHECFYEEKIDKADPILKVNDELFMWLIPYTYDPYDLEFDFECDEKGIKGQYINSKIIIGNNKKFPITDLCIQVESFANDIDNYWEESNESQCLISTKVTIDKIDSKKEIEIPLKIYIPQDYEVKEYDFVDFSFEEEYYGFQEDVKTLKVPKDLKIFVSFSYRSSSGFNYHSYVKSKIIKID